MIKFPQQLHLLMLLCSLVSGGCAQSPIEPAEAKIQQTKIIYQTSASSKFMTCLNSSIMLSPAELQKEKHETKKNFIRTNDEQNRLRLACLCLTADSIDDLEYSQQLLKDLHRQKTNKNSDLDGLVHLVGMLIAKHKKNDQKNQIIVSLEKKLEQLKKIEKIISDREKASLDPS